MELVIIALIAVEVIVVRLSLYRPLDGMLELYEGKHKIDVSFATKILFAIKPHKLFQDHQLGRHAIRLRTQIRRRHIRIRDLDRHCLEARDLLRVIAFFDPPPGHDHHRRQGPR
jgi:hypothetical protein